MKSEPLNNKVELTSEEKEGIIKSLVSNGISESLVRSVIATVSATAGACTKAVNCDHCKGACDSYFKVNADSIGKLRKEMDAKKIKMTNVDPAVKKILR